jgi:hypothetical protein
MAPLLKHDEWSAQIRRLISYPKGRSALVATQLTTAFSSHHPRLDGTIKMHIPPILLNGKL